MLGFNAIRERDEERITFMIRIVMWFMVLLTLITLGVAITRIFP